MWRIKNSLNLTKIKILSLTKINVNLHRQKIKKTSSVPQNKLIPSQVQINT
jgi:hypothetical protein